MKKKIEKIMLIIYIVVCILPIVAWIIADYKALYALLLDVIFIGLSICSYKSYLEIKGKAKPTREISLLIFCNLGILFTCIKLISYVIEKIK